MPTRPGLQWDVRPRRGRGPRGAVVSAPRLAIDWLQEMAARRKTAFEIELRFKEGRWVGAGEPLLYVTGPLHGGIDSCWRNHKFADGADHSGDQ